MLNDNTQVHWITLAPGGGGDDAGADADIVDDGALEPGNDKVHALPHDVLLHSGDAIENDCPLPTIHAVHTGGEDGDADARRHSPSHQLIKYGL